MCLAELISLWLSYTFLLLSRLVCCFQGKNQIHPNIFFANRNIDWFIVGSALIASNIGSEHFGRINHLSYN